MRYRYSPLGKYIIRFSFTIITLFFIYLISSGFIAKNRWNDRKAIKVFRSKGIPLTIKDTSILNRRIHYAELGNPDLPALVFIHGSPGSWFHYIKYMWDDSLRKNYRMISIDRPGFGFSDFGQALHLQEQAKLLLPLLNALKKDQPMILVGHSYGGPLVAKLAADAPGKFEEIVIIAGTLDPSLEKKEGWRHLMEKKPLRELLPGAFRPSNTELLYLKEDLKPLANDLAKITCPVSIVHGDKDNWVPIENIAYIQRMFINSPVIKVDTLRGAGHQIPWKNREALKAILLQL